MNPFTYLLDLTHPCVHEEGGQRTDRSIDRDVARQCRNAMRRPDALGLRRTNGIDRTPTGMRYVVSALSWLLASPWRLPSGRQNAMGRRCAATT
jgi:hypothetical protein